MREKKAGKAHEEDSKLVTTKEPETRKSEESRERARKQQRVVSELGKK